MPKLAKSKLREHLAKREIFPVYVLYGEETFLRDIAARFISDRVFEKGDLRDFNEDEFSLREPSSLLDALAAAEQMPMMASRRVIRVRDVSVASTSQKDTLKEDYSEQLSNYLSSPSQQTVVIFVADEFSGNRKVAKLLADKATVVEFSRLSGKELEDWAASQFAEQGAAIDRQLLRRLLDLVGPDLRRLSNQITKLSTAALPSGTVTSELVDLLVERTSETDHFGLAELMISGKRQEALATMRKLLDDGAEPLAQIGLLGYNFRKIAMSARGPRGEWAHRAIIRNADTDIAIKTSVGGSGPAGARLQFERLILESLMPGEK